jgi:CSLREA domain-containing protein/uncharacterized repeat protein (TIGR01451 family)
MASCVLILVCLALTTSAFAAGPAQAQTAPSGAPRIWLQNNRPAQVAHVGPAAASMGTAQPLSMVSVDFDADGVEDLVVGYSTPSGGVLAFHRGNLDAFAPQSDASFQAIARGEFPEPFLPEAQTLTVPVTPDFIAAGDFTGHGNTDLAVAARGGSTIYIYAGDGTGTFSASQTINLPGGVTALAAGAFGSRHLALIVGVSGSQSFLAVYGPGQQGLTPLAAVPVSAPASNLVLGDFGDPGPDAVFLSGGTVSILRSATMKATPVALPVTVRAFALGSFIFDRTGSLQIAVVAPDGSIQIAARNEFDPRSYTVQEFQAIRWAKIHRQPAPAFVPSHTFPANGWKIVEGFPSVGAIQAGQAPVLLRTRISINGADDVLWLNAASGRMALITHADGQPGASTFAPGQVSVKPYSGTPLAASVRRLNVDGRLGVVALHQGETMPSLSVPIPDPTFTVNTTSDGVFPGACAAATANQCTLREAILEANGDTIMVPAGTYSLTIGRGATQDYSGNTGALYVNHTATIVGAGQNSTIVTWGAPAPGGTTVDMVMAVNEDVSATTTATASLSNLTIQNGVNHGASGVDGDGGCMEFDTGTNGTAALSLTNVTLQNCSTLQGGGGGIVIFNFVLPAGAGGVTISNSIIQGNSVVNTGSAGLGGGIAINFDAHLTMTNSQVINNSAVQNCTPTCGLGAGGGILAFAPQNVNAATGESFIHSSTISGNKAAGFGGGINTSASISIDQGTVISGNIAGTDGSNNTAHANQEGGGLYLNPAASCPLASTCTASLSKVTITGNKATGNGGGISYGNGSAGTVGALTMSFSRLAGNATSAGSGSNLSNNHGTATVTDNWWGINTPAISGPGTINNISGTTTFDPFIVLSHTPQTPTINLGESTALIASFLQDNHGLGIPASSLDVLLGLPITFNNPIDGTLSNPEAAIQPVNTPVSIASTTESGSTVTITTSTPHGFAVGQGVVIAGVGVAGYNGTFTITGTPTGTTFTYTDGATGLADSSGGTATIGPAGTAQVTFTGTIGGTPPVVGHADATVDSGTATANINIVAVPPAAIKAFGAATIPLNGTTSLTFTIPNGNAAAALTGVAFTDSLPSGLVVATPGNVTSSNCGGTVTAADGASSVALTNGTIAIGATCTISLNVTGTTAGVKINSVQATSSNAGTGATSSATLTVVAPATINKAFNPTSVPLNGTSTLTFTISNPNTTASGDLTGVAFSDTLPLSGGPGSATLVVSSTPNVSNTCSGTVTATAGTGVISLSGGTVAHNASCTVNVDVRGAVEGDANNTTGAITSTEGGTGTTSNTATLKVVAPPTISKAFGAISIALNGTTTVTFTITNPASNTSAETGIAFSDTLTNGLQVASTPGVTNSCGGTVTATANSTSISLVGGTIATPGATCTIVVNVTGTQSGSNIPNTTGAISSTNGGTGATSNTATITVASPPSVTKTFAPTRIPLNGTTLLTINITNPNSNVALTGLAFTDNLPAGLVVASTPNLSNTCGGTPTATGGASSVSLSGGTVAASASCAVSVNVQGMTAGDKINSVQVSSTEGGNSNTSNATVTVVAPPTISKAFGAASIALNGTTTVTFTITNPNNPGTPANGDLTGVAFTDTLPSATGTLVVAATPGVSNTCGGTVTATAGTGVISLSGGSVAHNTSCTLTVNVTGTAAGDANNTTGAISSTEGGTGTTSNTVLIKVVAPPSIAKVFNPPTIALNATTSLTFTITNPAANTVQENGVAFNDTLPSGLTVNSTTSTVCGGTFTTTNPTGIALVGATIAVNSQCQFSVVVTGAASGQYTNTTGTVSSTNGGTGNTATANLTVASPPTINKGFNPTAIPLNGTSTITFTITNPNSNVTLTGVAFTDSLPAGLVVAPVPNVSNSCAGSVSATAGASSLSLSGGVVNQGGSCTLSVDAQGTTAGTKLNTTGSITSNEGGPGTPSNTASLNVNQAATTTTVNSSSNPAVFGVPVTFTAIVTDTSAGSIAQPTGFVQFVVDGVNFGPLVPLTGASSNSSTATSQATATLSVSGSPHNVIANYLNVDGNFINSTGSLGGGQTTTPASTTTAVISSSNPSVDGQAVTFTATITDTSAGSAAQPTGLVQFVVDGINFGPAVVPIGASSNSSTATSQATTSLTVAGSPHSVTANYVNTDGNFINSTGSLAGGQVVNKANTTITVTPTANPITLGDTVTFTATVTANPPASGTPTGLVMFFDGSTPLAGGKLSAGQATFSTAVLAVGSHSITAIYQGDANFTASPLSSPITETVNLRGTGTTILLNPSTVSAGQASTITMIVADTGASVPPGTPDVFSATGAPGTGRTGFTATLFADGAVVIIGGTDANNTVLKTAEVYNAGSFIPTPGNLNTARTGAVAVLLANDKVLVAGGSSNGVAAGALNSAELLDLRTGTFAPTSHNMTAARFGMTATLLNNGKVLIAGGQNSGGVVNSAELYDPATDTFTATGNLNAARTGASATLLGTGKVLVAGGSSDGTINGALKSAEVFDPAGNGGAGTFTSVAGANPTLSDLRWQPEAALLLSGKVLIAGGQNSTGPGPVTTADLYDPAADSFTASGHQMNEARANGSAVALPSGMVLLAGGTTSQNVDLYDAEGDKFNPTGSLLHHGEGLVSTLLNNGQVLVVGLNSDNPAPFVSDAELYSPSFNPLGTIGFNSSDPTDVFGAPCVLAPSTTTASTCTSTVTPIHVGTSPHTITGTYPADAVHSGSSNTASLTVIPTAPPTIAKAFSAANVGQNSKVNVSFTIVNPNTAATLTGISFTDSLPAGLVVATPNNLNSSCGGTVTAVAGSSSISLTGGTEGPSGGPPPCVITIDLLVTGTGVISNTTGPVSANESGPGNPSNTATLQVVLAPTVNKAFGAASIPLNGTTSLTFNIANPNTSVGLVGIALSDTLPSGLVVASPNGLTGTCVASSVISATPGSGSINMSLLNLPATGSCSFSVNVKGTSGGTKNNTTGPITGTFDDGSGTFILISGGTASASIAVVLPPSIAKAFNPAVIAPGGISTLTFTITNPAVNTVAEAGVAFTDTLPTNLVVATPNGATGNCNGGTLTAVAGSGSISLVGGSVPVGSSCAVSVNVTSATAGTYNNTSGAVTSTNGGTGNTASASLTVAHATLSITKTHTDPFSRGQTGATYTITVSSLATAGPTAGTVTVTDTLPNVPNTLVATGLSGTGWTCTLSTLTCTRTDSLAPGASYPAITLTVSVPGNIRANVTNSATVSGGGDPNSHTANDPTHIGPPIQLTFANGSATVTRGQSATFMFTLDSSPGLGPVTFSSSGVPPGSLCTFSPPSSSLLTDTITMNCTTSGPAASAAPMFRGGPTYALFFPALGLVGLVFVGTRGKKNRKTRLRWAMALSGLVLLLALAGCGGRPGFAGTPPGTYTITVTGSSGTTSGSAPVTLNVQ